MVCQYRTSHSSRVEADTTYAVSTGHAYSERVGSYLIQLRHTLQVKFECWGVLVGHTVGQHRTAHSKYHTRSQYRTHSTTAWPSTGASQAQYRTLPWRAVGRYAPAEKLLGDQYHADHARVQLRLLVAPYALFSTSYGGGQ
eukprot:3941002-Rhodomonas_salina.2